MKINNLKDKKVAILWFWKEWKSSLLFLLSIWVKEIWIFDKNAFLENDFLSFKNQNKKYDFENISLFSWEDYLLNLEKYDFILKSPGVSPYNDELLKYKDKFISQSSIFFDNYNWKIIWITWTKGKSTISTLTYKLLINAWFKAKLVWNIWTPVFGEFECVGDEFAPEYDFVVYELSSYMLEDFESECYIWVLNNIFPDHLDWHKGFSNYKKAKENILKKSTNKILWTSLDLSVLKKDLKTKLLWEHNLKNIRVVFEISNIIWIRKDIFYKTVLEFKPLSHRLENIWTYKQITFIDDAISTTPESTIEAIKTFWSAIGTIFLWWSDRGYDFSDLVLYLKKYFIKNLVLFPDSSKAIKKVILDSQEDFFNILETSSMKEAVLFAFKNTSPWSICLLSCASPSYSLWKNFEEKWEDFKENVLLLITKKY